MRILFAIIGAIIMLPIAIVLAVGLAGGLLAGIVYLFTDVILAVAAVVFVIWGGGLLIKWLSRKT